MELSDRIKKIRLLNNITQKDISEKLEIAQSTYQYYERGERDVPGRTLKMIITIFGVNPGWLMTGEGGMFSRPGSDFQKTDPDSSISEIVNILKTMDNDDIAEIREFVRNRKKTKERIGELESRVLKLKEKMHIAIE